MFVKPDRSLGWILILLLLTFAALEAEARPHVVPTPKELQAGEGMLALTAVWIEPQPGCERERAMLEGVLRDAGVPVGEEGVPARLLLRPLELPVRASRHAEALRSQGYVLRADGDGIRLEAETPLGLRNGIRTLRQLLEGRRLPHVTIRDWPDIPLRMLMIDPARQNENMDYYRRVIDFAARHKMNAILCHLTDDQTSALWHEDYPELMHPQAWTPEEVRALVLYAGAQDIELIPEIESLGHSRMFTRLPDHEDYLHQTAADNPDQSWMGTDVPGLTNVLCPASPKGRRYLGSMYRTAAENFRHPWIHIGFDEVDMTECARCREAFGTQTEDEWLAGALAQAGALARGHAEKVALWGDMVLAHPAVLDTLDPATAVIFDWHYTPEVKEDSVDFFAGRGFEVVASPALVCAPHMVMPDTCNLRNIANFTRIAREKDLGGINTTIWVPTRYMSDVLWPGIAFAAEHAWGGGNSDEQEFLRAFAADHFGMARPEEFAPVWTELTAIVWHRAEFYKGCWADEASLAAARETAGRDAEALRATINQLQGIGRRLEELEPSVGRNRTDWQAIATSAAILQYSMEHLLAAAGEGPDEATLRSLDARCVALMEAVEADWDRNRFADDPAKEGLHLANQHLLFRFRQMHRFHQGMLETGETVR